MLRSEAVARIKRGLDFRTVGDDNIVSQLQESQRYLERGKTLPHFLIFQEDFALTAGTAQYAVPTRFLMEADDEPFHYVDDEDEYAFLEKLSYPEALERFGQEAGAPRAYALLSSRNFVFFPTPDTDLTLTWSYYRGGEVLTSDIENVWLAENPEVLIGHAGMVYAKDLGNVVAATRFGDLYQEARLGQIAEDIEVSRENDPIYLGGRL
jgi:hypothetical protein